MRVAVLGATSRLASDYVYQAASRDDHQYTLFARDPAAVAEWLARCGVDGRATDIDRRFAFASLASFDTDGEYDAVVNFIGVGDPARAKALGADIFTVTREWDDRALAYLDGHSTARYVFLSSGAVYGGGFDAPVDRQSVARFPVNALDASSWYGLAKLGAEAVHRARPHQSIIDLRIFNYVSRFVDVAARFLITDAVRAIRTDETLDVSHAPMVRDFLGLDDLYGLIAACLDAPAGTNAPADAFSRAPIAKDALLQLLHEEFGLRYRYDPATALVEATGSKANYYSMDRTASAWGYQPTRSSADVLRTEIAALVEEAA